MTRHTRIGLFVVVGGTALVASLTAQQPAADDGDLGGVVRGPSGPEAGVWVIAETDDLDTRFRKIVVTDDDGRFLVPDLPAATYRVWVRGYGLVDSAPVTAEPGHTVNLDAVPAGSPQEAAQVYPANYWYSLLEPPPPDQFPGTARTATVSPRGSGARRPGSTSPSRAASCVIRWATASPLTRVASRSSIRPSRPGIIV